MHNWTLKEKLTWAVGFAVVGLCTVAVCATCTFLYVALRPLVGRRRYRKLVGAFAQTPWIRSCMTHIAVDKVRVSGDLDFDVRPDSLGTIVVSNHQIDFDGFMVWFFLDLFAPSNAASGGGPSSALLPHEFSFSPLSSLKILLKGDLAYVPFYGWGMAFFEYVFLARNWRKDRRPLETKLRSFREDRLAAHVLIFPEGTTLNERSQTKGNVYNKENGRPTFEYLISPRTTGFRACMDAMTATLENGEKQYPSVYDITVAYDGFHGEVPDWELGFGRAEDTDIGQLDCFLAGRSQKCVHVHFKKYEGKDVDEDFLDNRWKEKDALLSAFRENQTFPKDMVGETRDIVRKRYPGTVLRMLALPWILLPLLPFVCCVTWPLALVKTVVTPILSLAGIGKKKQA